MKPSAFMNGKQVTANQPSLLRKTKKAGRYETSYSKIPQTQGNKHLNRQELNYKISLGGETQIWYPLFPPGFC